VRLVVVGWLAVAAALTASAGCNIDVSLGRMPIISEQGGGGMFNPGAGGNDCNRLPDTDNDADGFMVRQGDCDDCDPHVNPNAVEVAHPDPGASRKDEDCDGSVDEKEQSCDQGLAIDDADALHGANAMDLCKTSRGENDWGIVEARWTMPDGSNPPSAALALYHLGHGMLPDFGPNVETRRGQRMLVLSSGNARRPGDPDFVQHDLFSKGYVSAHPPGFPKPSPSCPNAPETGLPNDAIALEVTLRAPSNAYAFSFDFNFYTYEWPIYICSQYNDFFIALLSPPPPSRPDGNISFDGLGNPVSVNNAFLEVCGCPGNPPSPCMAGNKMFDCALGNAELVSTGFGLHTEGEDHAATSWLSTRAPVVPSSTFRLRFAIYDSDDGGWNSSTLIDNFQWIAEPGTDVNTAPILK
jgi:hypothetical protein